MQSATPSGHEHEREESKEREAVLEAAGSPRSTLVYAARHNEGSQGIRRELNPYLLVHSQACSKPLHHRHQINQQPDQDLNPELCVRTAA